MESQAQPLIGWHWRLRLPSAPLPGCHCIWNTVWTFLPCCAFPLPFPPHSPRPPLRSFFFSPSALHPASPSQALLPPPPSCLPHTAHWGTRGTVWGGRQVERALTVNLQQACHFRREPGSRAASLLPELSGHPTPYPGCPRPSEMYEADDGAWAAAAGKRKKCGLG